MEIPENLSERKSQLIDTLRVNEHQPNSTKKETRKQENKKSVPNGEMNGASDLLPLSFISFQNG